MQASRLPRNTQARRLHHNGRLHGLFLPGHLRSPQVGHLDCATTNVVVCQSDVAGLRAHADADPSLRSARLDDFVAHDRQALDLALDVHADAVFRTAVFNALLQQAIAFRNR